VALKPNIPWGKTWAGPPRHRNKLGKQRLKEILGGAEGNRTPDLLIANEALYHLSYGPKERRRYGPRARASSAVCALVLDFVPAARYIA
jgi:hypothetical protein